jgi:pimeloyl-ACP methyl ester carboxylesterase
MNDDISIERRFIATRRARIHVAMAGSGKAVLMLHQTPRSWDEFREVLPLIGKRYFALAMDTVGFGDSDPLPFEENAIESWAAGAFDLLDALEIDQVALIGHHTGAAIAIEMAASYPDRITGILLSAPPFVDAERRMHSEAKGGVDDAMPDAAGGHLADLWRKRLPYYRPGEIDLLNRFMVDALKAGPLAAEGHRVVSRYAMEGRLRDIRCPVQILALTDDPSYASAAKVTRLIAGASSTEIVGGRVALPNEMPEVFANAALSFLSQIYP